MSTEGFGGPDTDGRSWPRRLAGEKAGDRHFFNHNILTDISWFTALLKAAVFLFQHDVNSKRCDV